MFYGARGGQRSVALDMYEVSVYDSLPIEFYLSELPQRPNFLNLL